MSNPLWLSWLLLLASWAPMTAADYKVVAYVPNWIDLVKYAREIDYAKLTHINLAFENPTNEAGDLSFRERDQALLDGAHAARLPVFLSIGGGSAASNPTLQGRYFGLISQEKRAGFVAKLTAYVVQHGFDGLDVDIEGPSINGDYGPFVHELSAALRARGKLLTAALSQGYGGAKVPDSVFADFAWVNIMAYDATGLWNPKKVGPHSSVEFAKTNAQYWLERGLPKAKAVLGVPFYGVGFRDAWRKRQYPWSELVAAFPNAEQADEIGDIIYYNGFPALRAKAAYVREQGLAGMMIWSLESDVRGDKSLLGAMVQGLGR